MFLIILHQKNQLKPMMSMFEIFELSARNGKETRLLTPEPSSNFFYVGSRIWNVARNLIEFMIFQLNAAM